MSRLWCRNCNGGFFQDENEDLCSFCIDKRRICILCCEEYFHKFDKSLKDEAIICHKCKDKFHYKFLNIWLVLRFATFVKDDFSCVYCGRSSLKDKVKLHCDHIIPRSKGGEDKLENLATSCQDCNLGKSDILLDSRKIEKIKEREMYDLVKRIKSLRNNEVEDLENVECVMANDPHVGEGNVQAQQ